MKIYSSPFTQLSFKSRKDDFDKLGKKTAEEQMKQSADDELKRKKLEEEAKAEETKKEKEKQFYAKLKQEGFTPEKIEKLEETAYRMGWGSSWVAKKEIDYMKKNFSEEELGILAQKAADRALSYDALYGGARGGYPMS